MQQLHVFDTYAKSPSGKIMHFDVILPEQDQQRAIETAQKWLESVGEPDAQVNQENCYFCHSTTADPDTRDEVKQRGFGIFKLEGCPER
jgi:Domain of unknown function (DUF2024)